MSPSIHDQVDQALPDYLKMSEDQLAATIALVAVTDPDERSIGVLAPIGRAFVKANDRIRGVICEANNSKLIGDQITTDNVTIIVNLLITATAAVAPVGGPPAWMIALAVFVLKLGLNQYCSGYATR